MKGFKLFHPLPKIGKQFFTFLLSLLSRDTDSDNNGFFVAKGNQSSRFFFVFLEYNGFLRGAGIALTAVPQVELDSAVPGHRLRHVPFLPQLLTD